MRYPNGELITRSLLGVTTGDFGRHLEKWMIDALADFERTLPADGFPCLFGRKALGAKSFYLAFAGKESPAADAFTATNGYVKAIGKTAIKERIYKPLIIFFERKRFDKLAEEQEYAWSVLQKMHDTDWNPWPKQIPQNPHNENWSFCLGGIPLFVNMSFPGHRLMKSRNLGRHITFVINPRENFDEVASIHTDSGKRVREKIRERINTYNNGFAPETLGFYGQKESFEWKQYQLHEPGGLELSACPLHLSNRLFSEPD